MDYNNEKWHSPSRGRGATDSERGGDYRSQNGNGRNQYGSAHREGGDYRSRERFTPNENNAYRPRFSDYAQQDDTQGRQRTGQRPRFRQNAEGVRAERVQTNYAPRNYRQSDNYSADNRSNGYRQSPRNYSEDGRGYNETRRPRFRQEDGPSYAPSYERRPQRFSTENNYRSAGNVYNKRKRFEHRESLENSNEPMRLNKYLANAGICSRREADDFIQAGVITVNGEIVTTLGAKVLPTDKVMFHDQTIRRERKIYILLNKPKDCITTTDDPQERKTVLDIVKNACPERIYPVGRLDRNTTGVLLLTNDGDLAAKLTHPKYGKKKIYAATLDKDLTEESYNEIMEGIRLDDEVIVPDALEFTREEDRRHIGLEIHSGQNRVVRRIFEKVGYKVMQLDRVSFAGLTKKNVPRGKYRFLNPKEVAMLQMGAFE